MRPKPGGVRDDLIMTSWINELNSKYQKIRRTNGKYSSTDLNDANDIILKAIADLGNILKRPKER